MPRLFAALLVSAAVFGAVIVSAETPGQVTKPAPAPAVVSETAVPAAESRMHIEFKDDLLSLDLVDAEFGSVIKTVAARAGIKVEMSGPIQQKKLTTKFSGIELERGILRLMTLMKEKNYTLRYDTAGRVNALEVYGAEISAAPAPARGHTRPEAPTRALQKPAQPANPASSSTVSGVQKNPPPQRRLILPSRQTLPTAGSSEQPPAKPKKPEPVHDDEGENDVDELPYIEPQKKKPSSIKLQ
ncbi:MAG: hypothetical protein C0402_16150 [Thermodesulfovibrio sp.]|nr:hypothetical protein [Thermodesulfovibrio sp.]